MLESDGMERGDKGGQMNVDQIFISGNTYLTKDQKNFLFHQETLNHH
jgi:hypothetical protein